MKPVRVQILGLKETEAALQALNEQVGSGRTARAVGLRALRAGGEILAKEARQLAPKFEMHLSESIDVSTRLTKSQRTKHKKFADVEMFVGPNDPAAIPQEFGTFKEPPQPFMRPAWDATKDQVLQRIADTLMVDVERTAKREAAKAARLAAKGEVMQNVLAAFLLSDPAIKAIVGTNIDWDVAAQGITGPHIVMFVISEPRTYRMNGEVRHYMTRVQFDCRATTALARRQLADALDAFLSGYKGVFGGIQFDGCFKDGHRTRFDMDGNTRWFQAQIDYRIFWAPAQG